MTFHIKYSKQFSGVSRIHTGTFRAIIRLLMLALALPMLSVLESGVMAQDSGNVNQGNGPHQDILDRGVLAGIEEERLETLITRARERQLSSDELNLLIHPAITLAEEGLPHGAVMQKTMEGIAKRVPVESIRQVLNNMQAGLVRSATLVDPWLEHEEVQGMIHAGRGGQETAEAARTFRNMILENTSYAIQQNVSEEILHNFLNQIVSENALERSSMTMIASAVRAFPDLPDVRENPEMANRILIRALNAGFHPGEIQQLPEAFRSAQLRSQMPLENIARGLDRQMDRGIPAQHILENLFQGNIGGGPPGFTPPGLERNGDSDDQSGRGRGRGNRPDIPPDDILIPF
ncbi:MAG: hypothetical protein WD097_05035 [Balneolales bacterium]